MKNIDSLRRNEEFQNVYKNGRSYANKYLVMYCLKNHTEKLRLGISVSKKVGNSVVRHRIARLIRESYRQHKGQFSNGLDMIVVARASAKGKGLKEIESSYLHLAKMHGILLETNNKRD